MKKILPFIPLIGLILILILKDKPEYHFKKWYFTALAVVLHVSGMVALSLILT